MERKKPTLVAANKRTSRALAYAMVSLVVMGGAISAGSALGKNSNNSGTTNNSNDDSHEHNHDGDDRGVGGNGSSGGSMNTTHIVYHLGTEGTTDDMNLSVEIMSFSFGVENPTTIGSATGGAGAGKVQFNELTVKKTTDAASPKFFKNCATGAHYQSVILEVRRANATDSKTFLTFKFGTVFTTKIDWSGPGDEGPEESITFVYGTLRIEYTAQNLTNSTLFGWDQVKNTELNGGGTIA